MTAALIEADGIGLVLDGKTILHDVSLKLEPNRLVTLIGPNGAGKSSLVGVLLGLRRATGGQVRRRDGLAVGYMPQKLGIDPILPLTVRRFLTLTGKAARGALRPVLEEVRAPDLIDRQMHHLSGGELQRVMLARALLCDPELLVLDEPAKSVDAPGQDLLYDLIERIRDRRGCGILMVSHDLHLVMARTDEVICLDRRICCRGAPLSVGRDPAYLKLFTPKGLIPYVHRHDRGGPPDGAHRSRAVPAALPEKDGHLHG